MLSKLRRKDESAKTEHVKVTNWARQARTAIAWTALALATVYAFLTFTSLPYKPFLSAIDPNKFLQIIMIFYYFSWVWGLKHDTDLQELVYATAPAGGKLQPSDIGVIILIFVAFLLLIWSMGDENKFAGLLTSFFVVNIFAWRYLLGAIMPAIVESEKIYGTEPADFFALEILRAFVHYISGTWQWFRFAAMGVVLALVNVVTFVDAFRKVISDALEQKYLQLPSALTYTLLPDALFVVFTIVAEGWIWNMRMRTDFVLKVTNDLKETYELRPRNLTAY